MSKFLKFIVNVFLVVAILTAVAILVPPLLGVNTTIVDSAGMDTNLPLGSVTYSVNVPVTKLQAGDEVLKENGTSTYAYIIEEGDAGTGKYKVASAVDRDSVTEITLRNTVSLVKLSIPYIGYVVVAMQTIEGIIIIVLVVLFVIILFILSELWKPKDDDDTDTTPAEAGSGTAMPAGDEPVAGAEFSQDFAEVNEEPVNNVAGDPFEAEPIEINDAGIFDFSETKESDSETPMSYAEPAGEAPETAPAHEITSEQAAPVYSEGNENQLPAEGSYETNDMNPYSGDAAYEEQSAVSENQDEEIKALKEDVSEDQPETLPVQAELEEDYPLEPVESEADYSETRADFLEANQFVAVDRLTLEEILEHARKKGGEPEVNKDDISGVNIVDYSKLI